MSRRVRLFVILYPVLTAALILFLFHALPEIERIYIAWAAR